MYWLLIAALIIIAVLLFKFKEVRHRSSLLILIVVLIFFVFTFGKIYSQNEVDLKTFDGIVSIGKVYFSWLGNVLKNFVNIGGYAVKQDWSLNVTNLSVK